MNKSQLIAFFYSVLTFVNLTYDMKNKFLFLAVMSIAATSNSQSIPKDPFAGLINRSGNLEFESGVKIIENKGQIKDENNHRSSEVLFAIQGNGGNAYLKSNALCIQFNHWFSGDKIGKRIDQFWSAYRFDLKLKTAIQILKLLLREKVNSLDISTKEQNL